jgi:hypothetical protein
MRNRWHIVLHALVAGLLLAHLGCGIKGVEGHYTGSVTGTMTVLAIPFLISGDISFDLMAAGTNNYDAVGDLIVRRKDTGAITYEATLSGHYAGGALSLTFTAKDGKSSGTISASTLAGMCWNAGTWTITGFATSGSGTWSACR